MRPADPTVDSQVVALKASGADIFVNIATPKFAAQAIKKVGELGWKPIHILNNVVGLDRLGASSPPGFENAKGILSTAYQKDPSDPGLKGDPGLKNWTAFMDKYFPEGEQGRHRQCDRLHHGESAGAGAQTVRR